MLRRRRPLMMMMFRGMLNAAFRLKVVYSALYSVLVAATTRMTRDQLQVEKWKRRLFTCARYLRALHTLDSINANVIHSPEKEQFRPCRIRLD